MKTEFEVKFYPINKSSIRTLLKSANAQLIITERKLKRTVFDKTDNPQINVDYLRVRDEGNIVRLSAKIHAKESGNLEDQKETDVIVSEYAKTIELLMLSGLKITSYQENLRETWELANAEVVIDTWPGLEPYIEIEADSSETVKHVSQLLDQDWAKRRITSIVEIYAEKYNLTNLQVISKLNHITFEDNPFDIRKWG